MRRGVPAGVLSLPGQWATVGDMPSKLVVPQLGESISEAIVGRWLKNVGDSIETDEPVVDLETDKINVQVPSPSAGVLSEQKFSEGDTVQVGDVIALIEAGSGAAAGKSEGKGKNEQGTGNGKSAEKKSSAKGEPEGRADEAREPEATSARTEQEVQADRNEGPAHGQKQDDVDDKDYEYRRTDSPARRRRIREQGLESLENELALRKTGRPLAADASEDDGPEDEVVPMSALRRTIAKRLVQAQQDAALLTTFNEVDMSFIMDLRKRYQDEFIEEHDIKLGFMSFFVKACIASLKEFPGVNAQMGDNEIIYKKQYHIGIAVGSGRGLVVPVLRDADKLGFADIEKQIAELAGRAQKNLLKLNELQGGTFTITNGGIYGSMMSTPLLNPPQTGILGMHNIVKRAVVVNDQVVVRPMMYIALTYDHRVVDGREAVQFLVGLKRRCENPERLLFAL